MLKACFKIKLVFIYAKSFKWQVKNIIMGKKSIKAYNR